MYITFPFYALILQRRKKNEVIKSRVRTAMTTDEKKRELEEERKKLNVRCDFIIS
jgi:hypothetical protein